jgi:dihydrodipicolinate synthase/N-acetylneuraminate lyase
VLVVAPHYYTGAMTPDALRSHYTRIADASPSPVILYNIPKYAHFALAPELVRDLAQHENVIGIKDSSGDLAMLERYLEVASPTFSVLTGNGPTFAPALERGARGGILAVALFAGPLTLSILERHDSADPGGARQAQQQLAEAASRIVGGFGVPGVKAALDAAGFAGGPVRSPLQSLDDAQRDDVFALVERTRVGMSIRA